MNVNVCKSKMNKIAWNMYEGEERNRVMELFEKLINERIRLEMMVNKLRIHQNDLSVEHSNQFHKIKQKHREHLNDYQMMLAKFQKHK